MLKSDIWALIEVFVLFLFFSFFFFLIDTNKEHATNSLSRTTTDCSKQKLAQNGLFLQKYLELSVVKK